MIDLVVVSRTGVLATIVAEHLPVAGMAMQTRSGVIACSESMGSVLLRRGLDRAGEIVVR